MTYSKCEVTFNFVFSADSWTVAEEEYFDVANNDDGTVNVSANLNIKPTSDLDGVTFTCTAHVVDDEGLTVNSEASNPLAVKRERSPLCDQLVEGKSVEFCNIAALYI